MANFGKWWATLVVTAILSSAARGQEAWKDGSPDAEDETGSKDPVSRANYGVLMKPIKTIYPATSVWMHVFTMPIPKLASLDKYFNYSVCRVRSDVTIKPGENQVLVRNIVQKKLCQGKYCQGQGRHVETEYQVQNSTQPTEVYKCILVKKIMSRLDNLKRAVIIRLRERRQDILKLVEVNSTEQHEGEIGRRRRAVLERKMTTQDDLISRLNDTLEQIDDTRRDWEEVEDNHEEIAREIRTEIPEVPDLRRRTKRFLDLLGGNPFAWVGKNLFGLASNSDVRRLAMAVRHLQTTQEGSLDQFRAFRNNATSFMRISKQRMDNMMETIEMVSDRLSIATQALAQRTTANAQLIVYAIDAISRLLAKLHRVQMEVDRFTNGIKKLIHGELSPDLISETVMRKVIEDLQERLRRKYNIFHLTETNPSYYYRYAKVHHFRSEDGQTLYVTMTFPLSSLRKKFYLYSVNVHNAPLKQGSEYTSRLRTSVDYFGITDDRRNYIELTQKELAQCEDTTAVRCTSAMKIYDIEHPTCIAALFLDRIQDIDLLCKFRFEKMEPEVEMTDVGSGKLMISNADFIILQCQADTPRQKDGCSYCRVEFMCGCSIYIANNASNAAMPARLTNCHPEKSKYHLEYPINMAVLANLYTPRELEGLSGNIMFDTEQIPSIPNMTVSTKYQVNINRDYEYSMGLKRCIKTAKQGKPISPITARPDPMWEIDTAEEFFTLSNVVAILATLVSIASGATTWYTLRSLRILKAGLKVSAAAAAMEMAPLVTPGVRGEVPDAPENLDKLVDLFSRVHKEAGGEAVQQTAEASETWSAAGTWNAIAGTTGMIVLVVYLLWKLYRNRAHTRIKLCVELASTSKSITLLVMKLPGAPANYHVKTDGSPSVIRMTGTSWKPELLFNWAGLTLTDRLSSLSYEPPRTAGFNPLYAKRVRSILEANHCMSIKFVNGMEVRPIQQVCGPTCDGVDCREVFGGNPFRSALYPRLSFEQLHENLRPTGTNAGVGEGTPLQGNPFVAYSTSKVPAGPISEI